MTIQYAIRKTPRGFILTSVEVIETFHGIRKYSSDTSLCYKRQSFAEQKAHWFYQSVYGNAKTEELHFIGVIDENEYRGEEVQS